MFSRGDRMSLEAAKQQSPHAAAFGIWAGAATLIGLATDFLRPLGPYALYALVGFAVAAIPLLLLSLVFRAVRGIGVFALIGAVVFGGVVALQSLAPHEQGAERGFLASVAPPLAAVQTAVLRVPPKPETRPPDMQEPTPEQASAPTPLPFNPDTAAFETALNLAFSAADPSERLRNAKLAVSSTDAAFTTAAINRLYRSTDPALRQAAIVAIFTARIGGSDIPIATIAATENNAALVNALQGAVLDVSSVDPVTGAIGGELLGYYFNGTIARSTIIINRSGMTISVHAEDDFVLRGTAQSSSGGTARVEIPLM